MRQHWAQVIDGLVTRVVVTDDSLADEERDIALADLWGGDWYRTDKNAWYGQPADGETPIIRGTYAGVGHTYDSTLDIFIPPVPDEPGDWLFNPDNYQWETI